MDTRSEMARIYELPLHQFLGVRDLSFPEKGRSSLWVDVNISTQNLFGVVHGGVYYTLCDLAAYAAAMSFVPDDSYMVTHDLHVSVIRPVSEGAIEFRGTVERVGRTVAFLSAEAWSGDKLVANARVTKSVLRK